MVRDAPTNWRARRWLICGLWVWVLATASRFCGSPTIFCVQLLQDVVVQHRIGQGPLQVRVLLFELPQTLDVVPAHAAELLLPAVQGLRMHALRPAKLLHALVRARPGFRNPGDLLVTVTLLLHRSLLPS
jgi:hypothetical protein